MTPQEEIERLVRENKTIEAIKLYRESTGAGLQQAREAIGQIQAGALPARPAEAPRPPDVSEVLHLFRTKGKIAAIQLYRAQAPGCGLKDAREAVERLAREHGVRPPRGGCLAVLMLGLGASSLL
jgi:ribosomal protein L7/L12